MICSVLLCPHGKEGHKAPPHVTFHTFPSDQHLFNIWVTATQRPNFIPHSSSRICSIHFENYWFFKCSGRLRKSAIPTLCLYSTEIKPKVTEDSELQQPLVGSIVSCIINPNATIDKVSLVRDEDPFLSVQDRTSPVTPTLLISQNTHKTISFVPSIRNNFTNSTNTVRNYDSTLVLNVSSSDVLPEPDTLNMQLPQTTTVTGIPEELPTNLPASSTTKLKQPPCPIKLVDVKKLLEKPPIETEKETSIISQNVIKNNIQNDLKASTFQTNTRVSKPPSFELLRKNSSKIDSKTTVSHVLDCLRIILPRTFVLSRLKPSEKVATLVIKYLKLDPSKSLESLVKANLKIIIDATKLEYKRYGDFDTHPYHEITEKSLSLALARIFPEDFCLNDVSNEKLRCLCAVLGLDVYVDGFSILRRTIRKFTNKSISNKGLGNETKLTENTLSVSDIPAEDCDKSGDKKNTERYTKMFPVEKRGHEKSSKYLRKEKLTTPSKPRGTIMESNEKPKPNQIPAINYGTITQNNNLDDKKAKLARNIKLIISFLTWKNLSAIDVSNNPYALQELCKFLKIKKRNSNIDKLKKMLFFVQNKNFKKSHSEVINKGRINCEDKVGNKAGNESNTKNKCNFNPAGLLKSQTKRVQNKLKLKPVVVLHDLVDFSSNQLCFMTEQKTKLNSNHKLRAPLSYNRVKCLQKYSSDYVRQITEGSYREFRKIIIKRDGERVVFRLHYKILSVGLSVFVKDFRYPSYGWFKGTVRKAYGPLRYMVQLDDGKRWYCVPEQMRPLPPGLPGRVQRKSKPKQLLNL